MGQPSTKHTLLHGSVFLEKGAKRLVIGLKRELPHKETARENALCEVKSVRRERDWESVTIMWKNRKNKKVMPSEAGW
jgi:hypothetical protein